MSHQVYTDQYQQVEQQAMDKSDMILVLYKAMIRNVRQAKEAMLEKDIKGRYEKLDQVFKVIVQLQVALDFDQDQKIATILYHYYSNLLSKINDVQCKNDINICDEVLHDLTTMLESWNEAVDVMKNAELEEAQRSAEAMTANTGYESSSATESVQVTV